MRNRELLGDQVLESTLIVSPELPDDQINDLLEMGHKLHLAETRTIYSDGGRSVDELFSMVKASADAARRWSESSDPAIVGGEHGTS